MSQKIRKTQKELKRKYEAAYRLRKKIGANDFPKRSRIITTENADMVACSSEGKILLKEFGFIIRPLILTT